MAMLTAFLGQETRVLKRIKVSQIMRNPHQPRKYFEPEAIRELADSIGNYGILNPLTVRKTSQGYELIAGERRLRAACLAGLQEVPCIVMMATEESSSAMALVENLQRQDLNFFEEAQGYRRMMDLFGMTQEETAAKVGKTQSSVANKLRLLRLPGAIMETIRRANLTERHARALLRLPPGDEQGKALDHIIENDLNVAKSEQYIEQLLEKKTEVSKGKILRYVKDVRLLYNTIDRAVAVMREGGVNCALEKEEQGQMVRLIITIPNGKEAAGE